MAYLRTLQASVSKYKVYYTKKKKALHSEFMDNICLTFSYFKNVLPQCMIVIGSCLRLENGVMTFIRSTNLIGMGL